MPLCSTVFGAVLIITSFLIFHHAASLIDLTSATDRLWSVVFMASGWMRRLTQTTQSRHFDRFLHHDALGEPLCLILPGQDAQRLLKPVRYD